MNEPTPDGDHRHPQESGRALARSRDDRYIGGVAAGLGRYFGVDATFVRLGFLITLVIGGVGVLAYLVLLATMPMDGDPNETVPPVSGRRHNQVVSGTILLGLILLIAATSGGSGTMWLFGFSFGAVFGILLWIGVAAALVWAVRTARESAGDRYEATTETGPVSTRPAATRPAPDPAGDSTTRSAAVPPASDPKPPVFAPSPSQSAPSGAATEVMPEAARPGSDTPGTLGRVMTWIAIGLAALVGFFILAGLSFGLTAVFGAIPAAAAVMVAGVAIVWLALAGRPVISIWLVGVAVALAIPMAVVTVAGLNLEGDWGDVSHAPTSADAVPNDGYKLSAGAMRIDLRGFPFRNGRPFTLSTESGFGATEVIVPDDVCVIGNVNGDIGLADLRGRESSGLAVDRNLSGHTKNARVLRLDSEFRIGYFGVLDATSRRTDRLSGSGDWGTERTFGEQAAARRRAEAACLAPRPGDRQGAPRTGPGRNSTGPVTQESRLGVPTG